MNPRRPCERSCCMCQQHTTHQPRDPPTVLLSHLKHQMGVRHGPAGHNGLERATRSHPSLPAQPTAQPMPMGVRAPTPLPTRPFDPEAAMLTLSCQACTVEAGSGFSALGTRLRRSSVATVKEPGAGPRATPRASVGPPLGRRTASQGMASGGRVMEP